MLTPLPDWAVIVTVFVPAVIGIVYSIVEYYAILSVEIKADGETASLMKSDTPANQKVTEKMVEISGFISEGAQAFLMEEYKYMAVYIVLFSCLIGFVVDWYAGVAFIVGALASIIAGWVGMKTAVMCNVRTAYASWTSLPAGYDMAVRGGSVVGIFLVSIGVLVLMSLILVFRTPGMFTSTSHLYEALAGFGLGGSSIALFGRVGGGIYTKAADVGADLAGKNEWGLDEDDPRNPACIADNVGDNVGDVAGMGADLFGSFAEATCAALVITGASGEVAGNTQAIDENFGAMMFPLMLVSSGIIVSMLTLLMCRKVLFTIDTEVGPSVERSLKGILIVSTLLQTPTTIGLAYMCLPPSFMVEKGHVLSPLIVSVCVAVGLWSGLMIGFVTEYYTSHSYRPVRNVAESFDVSAATGLIFGLALGYMSCIIPCVCLMIVICTAHTFAGMYGIALGALGMLGTLGCAMSIDVYGPIADNAGGIAEMSEMDPVVRERTDALDAAGNTTAAIGKGFAIGSACLVSLALFGAFCVRAEIDKVDVLNQWTFSGILFGAMVPYWFSAMTMKSVGEAANDMVLECNRQFPLIMEGTAPDYQQCVQISTQASLREMIAPGALVLLSPLIFGMCLGKDACAGLLTGSLVSGAMLAISMSNSGGAWDNAKKYIESGGLGEGKGKKSQAHKNAVTGDTVGDPLKDTSGPALNIVMKLSAIVALVFGGLIAKCDNGKGGPYWLDTTALDAQTPIF